ncbi:MAG TPA: sigma-70 family RNA polymerase sigma factor [Gemmatimonadaceae bacterium]|jgi:RNA polymerase sigma factor (TIGR02999 family)|nr:sigma-70 family RNA polymerase sigma factor [Gemmatimonadaceae bacterium]
MPAPTTSDSVTELLRAWGAGDAQASETVVPLVYAELRRQAALVLRHEREGHTLQTTGLVHEAWLRLDAQRDAGHVSWESRKQFYAVAAQMMRRVLVDHARKRRALKRGGAPVHVTLGAVDRETEGHYAPASQSAADAVDLLALDDALTRLAALDPNKARLVELRYFAGLSMSEAAVALGVSLATAGREWAVARMWLRRELEG